MPAKPAWFDVVAIPALLRHARTAYGHAMRAALDGAGFDDVPRNGMYVLGGLAQGDDSVPLGQLIDELGMSKQAAGQLVETLVLRGYLVRGADASDRRKLTVGLTERGMSAAAVQRAARERIDAELEASVGVADVRRTRKTLAVLCHIGRRLREGTLDDG